MGLASRSLLLIALIGGLANLDRRTSLGLMVSQPICTGFLVGVVLGEPESGFLFGSVFQMVLLGVVSIRGSMLPDFSAGSVIGAGLFVAVLKFSAHDPSTKGFAYFLSFSSAIAASVVFGAIYRWWERHSSFLADMSLASLKEGRAWAVSLLHLSTIVLHFVVGAIFSALFTLFLLPVVSRAVHSRFVDTFQPLSSMEVLLPFIGLGFLLGHLATRAKLFWFAAGFVITTALFVSLG